MLALVLLLVFSLAGAGIAARADRTANQQRNAAVSNELAAESEALDATNPVTAAALASAAWKIDPTADARTSLLDVLAQPERAAVTAAGGNVETLAFSPDGKRFATATDSAKTRSGIPRLGAHRGRRPYHQQPGPRIDLVRKRPNCRHVGQRRRSLGSVLGH